MPLRTRSRQRDRIGQVLGSSQWKKDAIHQQIKLSAMSFERFKKYRKANHNKIGLSLGEFDLIKKIGQGGNGVVFSANIDGATVALKFLLSEKTGDSQKSQIARFTAEYFNIMMLENKDGIIDYIDYDLLKINDEEGVLEIPVIIMKLYSSSLANVTTPRTWESLRSLLKFLLNTVKGIHEQGIIHRDLKPENILYNGVTYAITDFGIASYNPDMFQVMAETAKAERLGNRLFSAPEQERSGVEPHETMDIYAIGQILQWYASGETHRGTGRKSINDIIPGSFMVDMAIEKCLANNPDDRFQSISEVIEFMTSGIVNIDAFKVLELFNEICAKTLPKNVRGFANTSNINKIELLFDQIASELSKFKGTLWIHNGSSNWEITLTKMGPNTWLFKDREFTIDHIWLHFSPSNHRDFILFHYIKGTPFIIDGEEKYDTVIVDDAHHISYEEYDNQYADIDDNIVDLSQHKVVSIFRQKNEGFFFIGTKFHSVLLHKNDKVIRAFCETYFKTDDITPIVLEKIEHNIGQAMHEDVAAQR